jgi:hypothetical protein
MTAATRRILALVAAAALVVMATWTVLSRPAPGQQVAQQQLSRYKPIDTTYPALLTDMKAGAIIDPEQCAAIPACVDVPLKIDRPVDISPSDDWFTVFQISWTNRAFDYDFYLYDTQQLKTENPPPPGDAGAASPYTLLASSATSGGAKTFEGFTLNGPSLGTYHLVIQDITGTGPLRLTGRITVANFIAPFESLEEPVSAPFDEPATDLPPTTPAGATTGTGGALAPSLAELPPAAIDPDLDALGVPRGGNGVASLSGPSFTVERASHERAPSTAALLLWLALVPALVVGIPTGILARRRRSILGD